MTSTPPDKQSSSEATDPNRADPNPVIVFLELALIQYINMLNARDFHLLPNFVSDTVMHNGQLLGLRGYEQMLKQTMEGSMLDQKFKVVGLHTEVEVEEWKQSRVMARLRIEGTAEPNSEIAGIPTGKGGQRISFHEDAWYYFNGERKIEEVVSNLDMRELESQLAAKDPKAEKKAEQHSGKGSTA